MRLPAFTADSTTPLPANARGSPAQRRAVYRPADSSGARRLGRADRLLAVL
jgi:hypothetical protein